VNDQEGKGMDWEGKRNKNQRRRINEISGTVETEGEG